MVNLCKLFKIHENPGNSTKIYVYPCKFTKIDVNPHKII